MRPCSPLPNPREMNLRAGSGFEARYQAYLAVKATFNAAEFGHPLVLGLDHRVRRGALEPKVGDCGCLPFNCFNGFESHTPSPCTTE